MSTVDDHNFKFKSLYIDLDLAIHQSLNSPRGWRQQKPLDSHEDFEFTMSHRASVEEEYIVDVASAEHLFLKGQILPLQQKPKLHSLQSMACPKLEKGYCGENGNSLSRHFGECLSLQSLNQTECLAAETPKFSLGLHDSKNDCFTKCYNEEISTLPLHYCPSHGGLPNIAPLMRCGNEEGPSAVFSIHEIGTSLMPPRRLDGTLDLSNTDSHCSSFRSYHSNYFWSSAEKDSSRDSSSSSRVSNGSYHDSAYAQGEEKKAPHNISKASHPSILEFSSDQNKLCDIMGEFPSSTNLNQDPVCRGKPLLAVSRLSPRRWSWKGLFTGLRKASKLWGDDGRHDVQSYNTIAEEKRPVFTFKELPGVMGESAASSYRRSVGHDWEWQANTYQFVGKEGPVKKGNQPAKCLGPLGVRDDCQDHHIVGAIYCLRSGGRQEVSLSRFDGGTGEVKSKESTRKVQGNAWNAKVSWNKCLNKMKKGTKLSVNACKLVSKKERENNMNNSANRMINEEDKMDIYRMMKAKSLSSTPLAKSPMRTAEYGNINAVNLGSLNGSYEGLYSMQGGVPTSTFSTALKSSNKKMGFAASCPASMRSSPHHSGLLAVVNKATPDLHTAIQGAIAHCKQSQLASANPPP
ncbi:hypothetical protein L7F22_023566 [Adiantum nelumboides]|nr:hypothetical protein [Adiantum nelumboides]